VQHIGLDARYVPEAAAGQPPPRAIRTDVAALLWVASLEYLTGDLQLAAEYGRWHIDVENDGRETPTPVSERGYVLGAYRVATWLQPGLYISWLDTDVDGLTPDAGREERQLDLAATLRFDVNANWIVKLEGHQLFGTAALDPGVNDDTPRERLPSSWSAFLVKTTAYF
jgi:hypothetical protein